MLQGRELETANRAKEDEAKLAGREGDEEEKKGEAAADVEMQDEEEKKEETKEQK